MGIDEDGEESDEEANGESGNKEASDSNDEERQQWTADLSNIVVDEFSAQSGIAVKSTPKLIIFSV